MSITTLLSNVPNLVKVLSLSAAVGTGGAALALNDAPSPMDTTPLVSSAEPTDTALALEPERPERGPGHATGLERAAERANARSADGHERARAARARSAERRAERGSEAAGERGSAAAREARAERRAGRGGEARAERRVTERAERGPRGHRVAAERRAGRGPF